MKSPDDFSSTQAKVPESQKPLATKESTDKKSPAKNIMEIFQQAGVSSKIINIENNEELPEVIIFEKKEISAEKMVRLYRGINHLDSSLLNQVPYAMRAEDETGKPKILENLKNEVDTLANSPTYENLLTYVNKVKPFLNPREIYLLEDALARTEEGILKGYSTRTELLYRQLEHVGNTSDSGIAPYLSASFDPKQAVGYGTEGIIIIDVPLDKIEGLNFDGSETMIKSSLDKRYITAILLRKYKKANSEEGLGLQLEKGLLKITKFAPTNLYDQKEFQLEREKELAKRREFDNKQSSLDVEAVRRKRTVELKKQFPEVEINLANFSEQDMDIYTAVKKYIFNYYKNLLEEIKHRGKKLNIARYSYQEDEGIGEGKKFDENNINEIMLTRLRELVLRYKRLEEKYQTN